MSVLQFKVVLTFNVKVLTKETILSSDGLGLKLFGVSTPYPFLLEISLIMNQISILKLEDLKTCIFWPYLN